MEVDAIVGHRDILGKVPPSYPECRNDVSQTRWNDFAVKLGVFRRRKALAPALARENCTRMFHSDTGNRMSGPRRKMSRSRMIWGNFPQLISRAACRIGSSFRFFHGLLS